MKILVYGSDPEQLKGVAAKLRKQGHTAHLRQPRGFTGNYDLETGYDVLLLLEECESVKAVYEAYNARTEDSDSRIEIREEFDVKVEDPRELAALEGHPYWPDMTIKELIEYAQEHYGTKILGRTKAEIINRVHLLWKEQSSKEGSPPAAGDLPVIGPDDSIPITASE